MFPDTQLPKRCLIEGVKTLIRTFTRSLRPFAVACVVIPWFAAPSEADEKTTKKLNVLFIVSDDLNTTVLHTYGQQAVQTPNIDRLASHGVRFDRAYCNYPVCNASRTSFLSGRFPESTKVLSNLTESRVELGKDYKLLPEYFKEHGYFTAGIGKIAHGRFPDSVTWDVQTDPQQNPNATAKSDEEDQTNAKGRPRKNSKNLNVDQKGGKKQRAKKRQPVEANEGTPFPWEATDNEDAEEPDGKTARIVAQLIEEHKDGPFFIAAGFHKPHLPHTAPKKYFDLYPPEKIAVPNEPKDHLSQIPEIAKNGKFHPEFTEKQVQDTISHYFAATTFMDAQVGILLDTLDRLDLWKNTVVIFIGDHGWHLGEHGGYWAKVSLFEESAKAPLIVAAPGFKANASTARLVEFVDIYPSLTELAGLPTPSNLEGVSFVPLLKDPATPWKKAIFTVVSRQNSLGHAVRTEKNTYIEWPDGSSQLYDYAKDPKEYVNLNKDPGHAQTVADLKKLLSEGWNSAKPSKMGPQASSEISSPNLAEKE